MPIGVLPAWSVVLACLLGTVPSAVHAALAAHRGAASAGSVAVGTVPDMTSLAPEVSRYTSLVEALASPEASEQLLLELPIITPEQLLALAGRAHLGERVRDRVHELAAAPPPYWAIDRALLLHAAITADGTTHAELLRLTGGFLNLRSSPDVGPVFTALLAHPACDDEVLGVALVQLRTWLSLATRMTGWETALLAVGSADPARALAARLLGHAGSALSVDAFCTLAAAARELTETGRVIANSLLLETPAIDPAALLQVAAGVARDRQ
jgi:hypothetical protein